MTSSVEQYDVVEVDLGPAPTDTWAERDVRFTDPAGTSREVPAFISKGRWKARYSSHLIGTHEWASDTARGTVDVIAQTASGRRLAHGPIRVAADHRTFEHADGTPFLWLGDTWWHGFVTGKIADDEFADLAAQRNQQGFTVVQIVAGLPCEVQPFDEANRARAGFAWEPDFTGINTEWWDDADGRIVSLVDNDLLPCILGSWGYHFSILTPSQIHRHWREMIARWSAYPVVWCVSGEPTLPEYKLFQSFKAIVRDTPQIPQQQDGADETAGADYGLGKLFALPQVMEVIAPQIELHNTIAHYVRDNDPFHRLITTHMIPGMPPWTFIDDESVLDFWMLQTGHSGFQSLDPTHNILREAVNREPRKPVVNGEVNYEGIADTSYADIQRFLFWSQLLAGAAGFTYGAHGIWAFNTDEFPGQHSGIAPHWKEAAKLSGAAQIGTGRKLLDRYPWAGARPAPEAAEPHGDSANPKGPRAIELADGRRLIYMPSFGFQPTFYNPTYSDLGDRPWQVDYIDVKSGKVHSSDVLHPDENGRAQIPGLSTGLPSWGDWLVELTPKHA